MRSAASPSATALPEAFYRYRATYGRSSTSYPLTLGWQRDGRDTAFLIGGADGHPESLLKKAALVLSFGAMTWPHLLARAMLAEQLYRAQQLLAGHPYHRA